jgi:hypothetical protein
MVDAHLAFVLPDLLIMDQLLKLSGAYPHRQGSVYFLWRGDELLYIGQTKGLQNRIEEHWYAERIPFDAWSCIACPDVGRDDMTLLYREELEQAYIRRYRPPYNRK